MALIYNTYNKSTYIDKEILVNLKEVSAIIFFIAALTYISKNLNYPAK